MKLLGMLAGFGAAGIVLWAAGQTAPSSRVITAYATPMDGRTSSQRHNALLAVNKLNGAEVKPGATFSFNRRIGSFSRDAGYRRAPVSYNGQLISDWGGGVCQCSTTLYNAALLSGMTIVERTHHRFCPSYVAVGRDAAVAYDQIDLKFKNPYPFPIRIHSRLEDRRLVVEFVASQSLPAQPRIEAHVTPLSPPTTFRLGDGDGPGRVRCTGKAGYDVAIYRVFGDQKELISQDNYPSMNRVVQYSN